MKKKIWKNYFDIVILPSKEISDYAIKLSGELARYKTKWILGKESFIPHISLYHIAIKPKNFDAFVAEIRKTIKNFSPGYLKTTVIEPSLLIFDKPTWIQKLQLKVIRNTLKYYDWDYGTDKYWHLNYLPLKMRKIGARFIKKYGTPLMGVNFRPHISLASFTGNSPKPKIKKAKRFRFKPTHIYIYELGPSHSCQRIVEKIPFLN